MTASVSNGLTSPALTPDYIYLLLSGQPDAYEAAGVFPSADAAVRQGVAAMDLDEQAGFEVWRSLSRDPQAERVLVARSSTVR